MIPGGPKVMAQSKQSLSFNRRQACIRFGIEGGQFLFEPLDGPQSLVPAVFQFARDQPVIRVDSVILPWRSGGLEARLIERELDLSPLVRDLVAMRLDGAESGRGPERIEQAQHLATDCRFDAQTAE